MKHANFLDSLSGIAALVRVANFLTECAEILNLEALFGFFTNLVSG